MFTRMSREWVVASFLIAASLLLSAFVAAILPETVPTHWNLRGEVDGYGSKAIPCLVMPVVMIGLAVLFVFLPALSPREFGVVTFRKTYLYVMLITMGLFGYLHIVILYGTWSQIQGKPAFDMGRMLFAGIFLFFGLLGNVLGKVRRNFYIGVRVPWTLASDRVWNDTHRFAAWVMVAVGVLGFFLVLSGLPILLSVAALLIAVFSPILYAFLHYKQLEKRGAI